MKLDLLCMPSVFFLLDLRNCTNRIDPLLASLFLVRDGAQQLRDFSSSRLWCWALPAAGKISLQTIYRLKCSYPRICPHIHTYMPPPTKHASNTPQNISLESLSGVLRRFRFHAESENPIFRFRIMQYCLFLGPDVVAGLLDAGCYASCGMCGF